jgi:hypothetical protein
LSTSACGIETLCTSDVDYEDVPECPVSELDCHADPDSPCGDAIALDCDRHERNFGINRRGNYNLSMDSFSTLSSLINPTSSVPLKLLDYHHSSSSQAGRSAVSSAHIRRNNGTNFLGRMVAKYPLISASIRSVSSPYSALVSSPSSTAPLYRHTISDGKTTEHIPIPLSRSSSPEDRGEKYASETLLDTLHGRLFENSDPWTKIKTRLSASTRESTAHSVPQTEDIFAELREAHSRRGVGFTTSIRISPPILDLDCTESTYSWSSTPMNGFSGKDGSGQDDSVVSTTSVAMWRTPSRVTEQSLSMSKEQISTISMHVDSPHTPIPTLPIASNDHDEVQIYGWTPHEVASLPASVCSTEDSLWQVHERWLNPIVDFRPSMLSPVHCLNHSIECQGSETVADPYSGSAFFPENIFTGKIEQEAYQDHESALPVFDCRERGSQKYVAGPLLFSDDLGDCDEV